MKTTERLNELRDLDSVELGDRLKQARRELYELRFKLAVGQLENNREIRKVRKDIARILTVIHRNRLEVGVPEAATTAAVAVAEAPEQEELAGAEAQVTEEAGEQPEGQQEGQEEGKE